MLPELFFNFIEYLMSKKFHNSGQPSNTHPLKCFQNLLVYGVSMIACLSMYRQELDELTHIQWKIADLMKVLVTMEAY